MSKVFCSALPLLTTRLLAGIPGKHSRVARARGVTCLDQVERNQVERALKLASDRLPSELGSRLSPNFLQQAAKI